jgi:hypothetical protein
MANLMGSKLSPATISVSIVPRVRIDDNRDEPWGILDSDSS